MSKESFILFREHEEIFESLTDKQAGQLIKAIFKYEETRELPNMDKTVRVAFIPIKQLLDKNYEKYIEKCEQNRLNGKKGGRPKKPKETEENRKKPNGYFENPKNLEYEYDNDLLDDDKRYYFNYLCIDGIPAEKCNESLKEQVNFFRQVVTQMIKDGKNKILDKLDLYKLSECWERMQRQEVKVDKEQYFIKCLENEVQ